MLFNHFAVSFTVAAAVKTASEAQHSCLGVAGTSLLLWGCLCHAAAAAQTTCPPHTCAVDKEMHPLWDQTELWQSFATSLPNRLCCRFKPLNTWSELFYRNRLKNFWGLNLSEASTHPMQGSPCLKQNDSPMWVLIFVFLSQVFDMFSLGLNDCFKGSDCVFFLCECLCGKMSAGLTDNLHSLTHKCLSLYKAIQQDFFF